MFVTNVDLLRSASNTRISASVPLLLVGDAKFKSVDLDGAGELTRVASVSPPFGFQFKVGKHEYAFYAKDSHECTEWMKALVAEGVRPCAILAELELDISGLNLPKFPKAHLAKQGLKTLNMANNQFTKLPDDFGSYAKLETLDASSNQLKLLPDPAFGFLAFLKDLNLSENALTALPSSFDRLTSLSSLVLSANKFTEVPQAIFSLVQLDTFNFAYNSLGSGSISSDIGKLTLLRNLDLSGCRLASLPDSIGGLVSLRVLEIFKNNLTTLPESISGLKLLTQLKAGRNRLTLLPAALPPHLAEFDFSHNPINDLPSSLGEHETYIEFVECPLTAIPSEHKASMAALKKFLAARK
jgi:Leucine-rich repeat (LRR) protein